MKILKQFKTSILLAKAMTFSSYLWLLFSVAWVGVIVASTKLFTVDPSYSPGGAEEVWLIPMLTSLFLGLGFFGITIVLVISRWVLKAPKWSPPFNFTAGKAGFGAFLVIAFMIVYMVGALKGGVSFGGGYSGQEIFDEVNRHRMAIGKPQVLLNEYLCDNLVDRWRVVKDGNYHQGFEDHIKKEDFDRLGFVEYGEVFVTAPSPREAVYWWSTSPGHKTAIEAERWTDGCAYAADGTAVVIFAHK